MILHFKTLEFHMKNNVNLKKQYFIILNLLKLIHNLFKHIIIWETFLEVKHSMKNH